MTLTKRERQILRLRARGFSDYRIGRVLRVSADSVGRSRRNALRKIERAEVDLEFAKQFDCKKLITKKQPLPRLEFKLSDNCTVSTTVIGHYYRPWLKDQRSACKK